MGWKQKEKRKRLEKLFFLKVCFTLASLLIEQDMLLRAVAAHPDPRGSRRAVRSVVAAAGGTSIAANPATGVINVPI